MKTAAKTLPLLLFCIICFALHSYAQLIRHTYRFQNTLTAAAPECGPELKEVVAPGPCSNTPPPGGSFMPENVPFCGQNHTIYHNTLNWGLQYPNTSGTVTTTYTIQMFIKTTNWGTRPWVRIIDFSNGNDDAGIYFKTSGTASPDHCLDFFPNGVIGTCPYFNNYTYYLLTFTRNGATGVIDVYVNNALFVSYNDINNKYVGTSGVPIYIFRDDKIVPCESGEANFAYLSFTNQYSSQSIVDSVYSNICSITTSVGSDYTFTPATSCDPTQNITVNYTGDIQPPGTGYTFDWTWDGATVLSGSGMGPYTVNWSTPGYKNVRLIITNNTCGDKDTVDKQFIIGSNVATTIDQTICEGDSYAGYTTSGTYIDHLTSSTNCDSVRTLHLTVNPRSFTTINHAMCEGQSFLGYTSSGTYVDTLMAANGCDSIRTLHLTVNTKSVSSFTQSICEGQSFMGYSSGGTYIDTLRAANGCDSIRTINLTVIPKAKPNLGPDTGLCEGDTLTLNPGAFSSYVWQDGSTRDHYVVRQAGSYWVTVTDNCGPVRDDITITPVSCDIYFPKGFTPNGDGLNDYFKILNAYNLKDYNLTIYNRWGQKIFQTYNYSVPWDGTFAGQKQPNGSYVWFCRFKRKDVEYVMKGVVTLIR